MTKTDENRLRKEDWYVGVASVDAAQKMVVAHHYAKGGSNTACYVHGLFRASDSRLSGIAWWLPPTRVAAESVNREYWKKVLALTRLVVLPDVPANACSFLMGKSIKLIAQDGRFVSLVTYADESQGHTGAIYRATNWEYVGKTVPIFRWIDPRSGRQVSQKATKNRVKSEMEALGLQRHGPYRKHKFVKHLSVLKEKFKLRP